MKPPETWLGNIQRAFDSFDFCESGCCKVCADAAAGYCVRCGLPHTGECLRGER